MHRVAFALAALALFACDDERPPRYLSATEAPSRALPPPVQTFGAAAAAVPVASGGVPPIVEGPSRLAQPAIDDRGPCPSDMAQIYAYCIDRYEAPNEKGAFPLVMESAYSAEAWCERRGKRLCTEEEWERACQGPQGYAYPYGDAHEEGACSDEKVWINKDESTIGIWPEKPAMGEVTRLYQAAKSGEHPKCVSGYGVVDMTGNVEEWVVAKRRRYAYDHVLKGCYWSGCYGGSKPTCKSTNAAHADAFKFYETGFRCCRDAKTR